MRKLGEHGSITNQSSTPVKWHSTQIKDDTIKHCGAQYVYVEGETRRNRGKILLC